MTIVGCHKIGLLYFLKVFCYSTWLLGHTSCVLGELFPSTSAPSPMLGLKKKIQPLIGLMGKFSKKIEKYHQMFGNLMGFEQCPSVMVH